MNQPVTFQVNGTSTGAILHGAGLYCKTYSNIRHASCRSATSIERAQEPREGSFVSATFTRVSTNDGTVQGFVRDGVARWRSIPYARPPMGPLRFRAPQPPLPWRGVRYCEEFAYCAPQDPRYTMTGPSRRQPMSEDCLTLNVVTSTEPQDG